MSFAAGGATNHFMCPRDFSGCGEGKIWAVQVTVGVPDYNIGSSQAH